MKHLFLSLVFAFAAILPTQAQDGLPVLVRITLEDKELWKWEAELTGHLEQNDAVLECLAESLTDLLRQADLEPTVESLVQVLTTSSEINTPQSSIKELILPRCTQIYVSQDASFALLITPHHSGGRTLEIFRETAMGLTAQRLKR